MWVLTSFHATREARWAIRKPPEQVHREKFPCPGAVSGAALLGYEKVGKAHLILPHATVDSTR